MPANGGKFISLILTPI